MGRGHRRGSWAGRQREAAGARAPGGGVVPPPAAAREEQGAILAAWGAALEAAAHEAAQEFVRVLRAYVEAAERDAGLRQRALLRCVVQDFEAAGLMMAGWSTQGGRCWSPRAERYADLLDVESSALDSACVEEPHVALWAVVLGERCGMVEQYAAVMNELVGVWERT